MTFVSSVVKMLNSLLKTFLVFPIRYLGYKQLNIPSCDDYPLSAYI